MIIDREPIIAALYSGLIGAVSGTFSGSNASGDVVITGVTNFTNLYVGVGVVGNGVYQNTTIAALDPGAQTVTVNTPILADNTAAGFTSGFLYTSRRASMWQETTVQPAMFLRHTDDDDDFGQTVLGKTTIHCECWIYSQAGADSNYPADIALNNLTKMIRFFFKPNMRGFPQTLGGLVQWARIEGRSEYDPGDLDSQSKAIIPISLLCP